MALIISGNIVVAIDRCRNIWASFPGAGYGQHENIIELLSVFDDSGGVLAQSTLDPTITADKQPNFVFDIMGTEELSEVYKLFRINFLLLPSYQPISRITLTRTKKSV